jgi:hypothetical protein
MDKIEYRAVVKFFVKKGLTPNEINSKFIKVYGDSSPSFSTIRKWAAKFKRGRTWCQIPETLIFLQLRCYTPAAPVTL